MGLFKSKEELEAKNEQKIRDMLDKYGLNMESYDDRDIKEKNANNIRRIAADLVGNGLFKAGMALSFAKAEEQAKVTYLSALVEQNWIIIRQNEAILRKLDKR